MTATGQAATGQAGARQGLGGRIGFVLVLLAALLLLAYVAGGDRASDPLDPESTQPDGAKGLVDVLEELGAEVEVTGQLPEPGEGEVALVLADRMDGTQHEQLVAWVRAGGRLVVADPLSPLTPPLSGGPDLFAERVSPGTCDIGALEGLDDVEAAALYAYEVEAGTDDVRSCFGDGSTAYVVSAPLDAGVLTGLAGAGPFTNELLDEGDNAPLAAALLVPEPGTSVRVLTTTSSDAPEGPGAGDDSVHDLVGDGAVRGVAQLAAAFLLYAAWRAIRLGKPVREPQPVQVEGSELVAAVGRLLQQNHSPQAAADLLRRDLRRTLEDRLGVPPDLAPEVAVDLVVDRTGLDPRTVAPAVEPTVVADDADLLEVAHAIDVIRAEVLHGRHP
jgi:hypothetical protein